MIAFKMISKCDITPPALRLSGPIDLQGQCLIKPKFTPRGFASSQSFSFLARHGLSAPPCLLSVGRWPLVHPTRHYSVIRSLDTLDTDSLRSSALALLLVVRGTGASSAGSAVAAAVVLAVFVFLMLLLLLFAAAVIVVVVVAVAARDRRAVGMLWLRAAVRRGGRGRPL